MMVTRLAPSEARTPPDLRSKAPCNQYSISGYDLTWVNSDKIDRHYNCEEQETPMSQFRLTQSAGSTASDGHCPLAKAQVGTRYFIHSLGDNFENRLELMAAGLAPDQEIDVLSVCQRRHCVVACGPIRAAIGADLAHCVTLRACDVRGEASS